MSACDGGHLVILRRVTPTRLEPQVCFKSSAVPSELTIGEVASRSGVAPSALRFYEEQGLIVSTPNDGNQRRYERAVLRRIALIQAGRAAGIPARPDPCCACDPA